MERSLPSSMPVLDKPGEEATRCVYLQFEYRREWDAGHNAKELFNCPRLDLPLFSVLM